MDKVKIGTYKENEEKLIEIHTFDLHFTIQEAETIRALLDIEIREIEEEDGVNRND